MTRVPTMEGILLTDMCTVKLKFYNIVTHQKVLTVWVKCILQLVIN